MFYWVKTNRFIKWLFRNFTWSIPNQDNKIYLTFDDGPTPIITPWVLDILKEHNIKATFFCIGKNIQNHPDIFKRIITEGHTIGNHTFNHKNGWKTDFKTYINDIDLCQKEISNFKNHIPNTNVGSHQLFRPPYGKITRRQSKFLLDQGYKIIMWDILTADFDIKISTETCYTNATKKVTNGSIIVFHDSIKAQNKLYHVLPKAIQFYKNNDFQFDTIK
jgi:peptidoglycan/xylan/chitin deacetylase (PgdA/CDA1 family)